jgi:RNA polymerase primary sigma factor
VIAAEGGDVAACRQLVETFLPAIAGVARSFHGGRIEQRELLQEGVAGLLLAARRYDPGLQTPFWAYASFWVRKSMQELIAELTRPVALSDRATRDLSRIRRARHECLQRYGTEPTIERLIAATGLTAAQVESLRATERRPRAVEDTLRIADSRATTVGDSIVDPIAERAYEQLLDELEIEHVFHLIDELEERERSVIRSHYGLGQEPRTLREIGGGLGLTAERARQIEAAALTKLRKTLAQPAPVNSR